MRWKLHVRFGKRAGKRTSSNADTSPRSDFTTVIALEVLAKHPAASMVEGTVTVILLK
jgi:hypothetical protein